MKNKKKIFRSLLRTFLAILIPLLIIFNLTAKASDLTEKERAFKYLESNIDFILDTYCGDISEEKLIDNATLEVLRYSNTNESDANISKKDLIYLEDTITKIINNNGGKFTYKELVTISIEGMMNNLDNYTHLYIDDSELFEPNIVNQLGIAIEEKDKYLVITKVIPESNAHLANIEVGDKIIKIDGISVEGKYIKDVKDLIKNSPNSIVIFSILKGHEGGAKDIQISKNFEEGVSAVYNFYNDVGYIRIKAFNSSGNKVVSEALNTFSQKGINKLILDIRDNPGGEVDKVIEIASKFVLKGLITKIDFKSKSREDQNYTSDLSESRNKLTVLVNGKSASGAEILASAIQDTNAGVIVGTKTFGSSKIQSFVPILSIDAYNKYYNTVGNSNVDAYELLSKYDIMPEEEEVFGWLKITIGEFYTPSNRKIDKVGISPNIEVQDNKTVNGIKLEKVNKLQRKQKLECGDMSVDIYRAEEILKAAGYDIDTPDCTLDGKTVDAIIQFQIDCGGYGYGVLDLTTQQWLNDKLDKLILDNDEQLKKAMETLNKE